jgi:hypothetical protein
MRSIPRLTKRRGGHHNSKFIGSEENAMGLRSELEELPAGELIEALSTRIYEPPLSEVRERSLPVVSAFRVVVLVIDFDTEVNMQGMPGFLENSTGLFLAETIEAFDRIGARETSDVLRRIEAILDKHDISPSRLRTGFAGTTPYQITTFEKLYGDLGSLPEEVEREAERLYLYGEEPPQPVAAPQPQQQPTQGSDDTPWDAQ